jgi:(6-4)DNA photolyase
MRAVYILAGERERESNFWSCSRPMPASFYLASTTIEPVDRSIKRLMDTAYLNHIERLMILGNFMLLCEVAPSEVYRWFREMFIDAYDWVMVPNVYGMSQYADGGMITTKPYLSSSSYILRMSNYKKGDWCRIWDSLYWRFLYKHRERLSKNPRMKLSIRNLDRIDAKKLKDHLVVAEKFLQSLEV